MPTRADDMIDRRRLRRKLTFWRVAAIAIVAIGLISASGWLFGGSLGASADHVAQIRIEGTILEDEELLDRLERVRESEAVKGLVLTIDSPGGTTAGGEAIFEEVRRIAEEKPVVAQVGTLAASAGYMIASAADHIVARQSSIVGSIGVIVQYPDLTGLMDKLGVGLEQVKSSPLKSEPSPFSPTTEEEREMISSMIMDSYDWFVGLVEDRRPLSRSEVRSLADGSVFTGRQGVDNKLVDSLGGERQAMEWLGEQGVDTDLEIVEWKERDSGGLFLPGIVTDGIAQLLGLSDRSDILREIGADRIFLDGMLSVWQPENVQARD